VSELGDIRTRKRDYVAAEIAKAAARLFGEHGYDNVTVDEIAAAAGISARTFFRYYATKDEVLVRFQRRVYERMVRALEARPADEGPVTAIRNAYIATSSVPTAERAAALTQYAYMPESGLLPGRVAAQRAHEAILIEWAAARMNVPADDPRARTLVVTMEAAALAAFHQWVLDRGTDDPGERVAAALDLLVDGLHVLDTRVRATRKDTA
jgi:AcrR family transcriptional regulator